MFALVSPGVEFYSPKSHILGNLNKQAMRELQRCVEKELLQIEFTHRLPLSLSSVVNSLGSASKLGKKFT